MLISLGSTTAAESAADPGIHEKMLGCGDSGSGKTLKYQNKEWKTSWNSYVSQRFRFIDKRH